MISFALNPVYLLSYISTVSFNDLIMNYRETHPEEYQSNNNLNNNILNVNNLNNNLNNSMNVNNNGNNFNLLKLCICRTVCYIL